MNFNNNRLGEEFFMEPTLSVAESLLGKVLVRNNGRDTIKAVITEVEAYFGLEDKASHASRGITPRNKIMFGPAGRAYVYLIYGMHYCLNIVTERQNYPAAVLIRGVKLINEDGEFLTGKILNGPGKLTKFLNIDKNLNGENILISDKLWIENNNNNFGNAITKKAEKINKGSRIGVDYAGEWAKKPWRFWTN